MALGVNFGVVCQLSGLVSPWFWWVIVQYEAEGRTGDSGERTPTGGVINTGGWRIPAGDEQGCLGNEKVKFVKVQSLLLRFSISVTPLISGFKRQVVLEVLMLSCRAMINFH